MSLYQSIIEEINKAPINVTVVSKRLPVPNELVAYGLAVNDYDRLSVAYGPSREGAGDMPLGEYVRSIEIPDIPKKPPKHYTGEYIDQP